MFLYLLYNLYEVGNPLNSFIPETSRLLFGQLLWRFFFSQFSLLDKWTTYFTSFPWTTSTPNLDSVWALGKFLFKRSSKLIFHIFSTKILHAAMWLKLPKGCWGQGYKKLVWFTHKILIFHFSLIINFSHDSIWCHLQCDYYELNVKFLIFVKNFYKVHSVQVWDEDPYQQK
jgi:hypothetical protein